MTETTDLHDVGDIHAVDTITDKYQNWYETPEGGAIARTAASIYQRERDKWRFIALFMIAWATVMLLVFGACAQESDSNSSVAYPSTGGGVDVTEYGE